MKTTDKILKEIHDTIKYQSERSKNWFEIASQISPLLEELENLEIDIGFYSTLSMRANGDRVLMAKIFRIFRRHGFKCTTPRPVKNASSWDGHFHKKGFPHLFFVYFASTVCQLVQVGTTMKEVPVYEVRCGTPIEGLPQGEPMVNPPIPVPVNYDDDIPF